MTATVLRALHTSALRVQHITIPVPASAVHS